jgi:hypothetical protein
VDIGKCDNKKPAADMLKTFRVGLASPKCILRKSNIVYNLDILQVDVEGMDDKVVYSFLKEEIYPKVIKIESNHLSKDRKYEYESYLERAGYEIFDYSARENIALKK